MALGPEKQGPVFTDTEKARLSLFEGYIDDLIQQSRKGENVVIPQSFVETLKSDSRLATEIRRRYEKAGWTWQEESHNDPREQVSWTTVALVPYRSNGYGQDGR